MRRRGLGFGLLVGLLTVAAAMSTPQAMRPLAAMDAPVVSLTALSGYQGHAFVYAQVTDKLGTYPAAPLPASPYIADWKAIPIYVPGCPYLWAVYVYDRSTGQQMNPEPPNTWPHFYTSTVFCPTAGRTPVSGPPIDIARARLDLDLSVAMDPPRVAAGLPTMVRATLSSAVTGDLGLYLSMAIRDWHISQWLVDFGDGTTASIAGRGQTFVQVSHVFQQPGPYVPQVTARIVGHAQAAEYGSNGLPRLVERSFAVEVGNSTAAFVGATRSTYLPPVIHTAVAPVLAHEAGTPAADGFSQIETLRGDTTQIYLRTMIQREGWRTIDRQAVASAHSSIIGWRYLPQPSDGVTWVATSGWTLADAPIGFRWDQPDRLSLPAYTVHLLVAVSTRYDDGASRRFEYPAAFSVTVGYSAVDG